jgi:hypothetical protein
MAKQMAARLPQGRDQFGSGRSQGRMMSGVTWQGAWAKAGGAATLGLGTITPILFAMLKDF